MSNCEACQLSQTSYNSKNLHTWCDGCGNYSIWGAVRNALVQCGIYPKDVTFVHDIGCNGNGADKIDGYGFKGLHGRSLPLAAGISLANSRQTVIASSGDGAVLAEGIGHLIHSIRSNYNFTFIIHNNSSFALTTGQASPTTPLGNIMNATPFGVTTPPINISQLVLSLEPTFYARGYSGHQKQLTQLLASAIKHKGFAIVEVLQACPTYNGEKDSHWFLDRIFDVNADKNYDVTNLPQAKEVSKDIDNHIATGIIYQDTSRKSFLETDIVRKEIHTELVNEVASFDITTLLSEFRQ